MRARHLLLALSAIVLLIPAIPSIAAPTANTFGPKRYIRTAGPRQTFADNFSRCAGGNCRLVVANGNPDGSGRVSSASIYLNDMLIFGPNDFNQHVDRLVAPVALTDNDQIKVVLNSKPGSLLTISVECTSFVSLSIQEPPGVMSSIWENGTVSLAIPLRNHGNAAATNVTIANVQAGAGTYAGPTPFTYAAGTINSDETKQLNAMFSMLDGHTAFPLAITGTYNFGASVCSFQAKATVNPPPVGNGGLPKSKAMVPSWTVDTAIYPAEPGFHSPNDRPNAKNRFFRPIGQPRNLFPAPPALSALNQALAFSPNDQTPPPAGSPNDVVFLRNQNGGNGGGYSGKIPPDPTVAGSTAGGFVMIAANTAVSYSTDYGKTFTTVELTKSHGFSDPGNPGRPDFFPQDDGGLCCDQVLHYVPSRNLMIWLLQYWSPDVNVGGLTQKGQNRLRIAFATPEAAAADFLHAWRWFDITPTVLGDTVVTDWFDYPDLAYSNGWLYISVDHGFWNADTDSDGNVIGRRVYGDRRWFVRASLDDMAGGAGQINLVYYEANKNGVYKSHFAQSAPGTMYYAALPDTSTISVFADPDASESIPTPKDLAISRYCKGTELSSCDYSVTAPDGLDWNMAPHEVLGGTYVSPSFLCPTEGCNFPTHFVYFAFDGGRDADGGRAYPYVRVEKIDADAINVVSEIDIWNDTFAFATAGMTSRPGSGRDEVAISLAAGGGGSYADNAVGFIGDFVVYRTTSSNTTQANGATVRYGDYFDVRNATGPVTQAGQGVGYATLGYSVTQCCNATLQYVLFGRNGDLFPTPSPPIR